MNDYFYNDSSFSAEIDNSFFVEIMIVDKTCPRKDLNFFHVCKIQYDNIQYDKIQYDKRQ